MAGKFVCTFCRKEIKGEVDFTDISSPVCGYCWEKYYDGVRYLPTITRKKLKEALKKAVCEITELKRRTEILKDERDSMIKVIHSQRMQITKLRKSITSVICRFLGIQALYYITDWRNLESILRSGIMCYSIIKSQKIRHFSFADAQIQKRRAEVKIGEKSAHDYVPLFLHFKPPILYRLQKTYPTEIIYICVNPQILAEEKVYFTDRNLASSNPKIFHELENLLNLKWDIIRADNWDDEARRIRGAEALVPERVHPHWFQKIVVRDDKMREKLRYMFPFLGIPIEVNPEYYY